MTTDQLPALTASPPFHPALSSLYPIVQPLFKL